MQALGIDFHFEEFHVEMIATGLSSQFMTHITTAVYLGLLYATGMPQGQVTDITAFESKQTVAGW